MPSFILNLLASALRLVVLAAFVFAFVVLFEHGSRGFLEGVVTEWHLLTSGKKDAGAL